MVEDQFIISDLENLPDSGKVGWRSPSNIALVKYWGKHGEQLPKNASISFTLSESYTETTLSFRKYPSEVINLEVYLDGKREPGFDEKIIKFFERISVYAPYIRQYSFRIDTRNSFPHSSGIASSASGMSTIALCLMSLEEMINGTMDEGEFKRKASFLARLGSGSASRSIEGPLVVWGAHKDIKGSSDLYGIKFPCDVHEQFKNFQDSILLVDKGEKVVSSTAGHGLMNDHPFAETRFAQANSNLSKLKSVLNTGDLEAFVEIVEQEALSLHAMMLSSSPSYILMKPNTIQVINKVKAYRESTGIQLCFTLDAGANVHLLYPKADSVRVLDFIDTELKKYCQDESYINDHAGPGAVKLPG